MTKTMLTGTEITALNTRFTVAVRESYANYHNHGPRSNEKIRPLHQWVADELQLVLGAKYVLAGLRKEGKSREKTIVGKYYDKNVDVSISDECGTPLVIISVKFVTSNFKQNANNYFEHLMGETANIRRRNIAVGHLMVLPYELPYLNAKKEIVRWETIKTEHLQKYVKLARDKNYPHRPDSIGVAVISLPTDNLEIELMDVDKMDVSEEIKDTLSNEFSVCRFICTMKNLVDVKNVRTV